MQPSELMTEASSVDIMYPNPLVGLNLEALTWKDFATLLLAQPPLSRLDRAALVGPGLYCFSEIVPKQVRNHVIYRQRVAYIGRAECLRQRISPPWKHKKYCADDLIRALPFPSGYWNRIRDAEEQIIGHYQPPRNERLVGFRQDNSIRRRLSPWPPRVRLENALVGLLAIPRIEGKRGASREPLENL